MFYEVFSLPLNVASCKKEHINEPNPIENACAYQSKCTITPSNSTKNPNAKVDVTYCHADK